MSVIHTKYLQTYIAYLQTYIALGCVIPPFLFQTYSASISFGYLAHKDFKNIRIFAVRHVLRSPQSQCLFFIILTKVLSEGNCYASPAPHTALDTRHIGTIFRIETFIVISLYNLNYCSQNQVKTSQKLKKPIYMPS